MVTLLPNCKELRRGSTPAEVALWFWLRGRRLGGLKFRRQHQFGPCILDFFCAEARVAVELDGSQHFTLEGRMNDGARTEFLESGGLKVIRFSNGQVLESITEVLVQIRAACTAKPCED